MSGVGGKFMAFICQSFVYIKFYHDNMKMEFWKMYESIDLVRGITFGRFLIIIRPHGQQLTIPFTCPIIRMGVLPAGMTSSGTTHNGAMCQRRISIGLIYMHILGTTYQTRTPVVVFFTY